jgi:hypothetical protein
MAGRAPILGPFLTATWPRAPREEFHREVAKSAKEEDSPRRREEGEGKNFTAKTRRAQRESTMKKTREEIERIAEIVVDAILKVHRALWPGLLKSAYQDIDLAFS